MKTHLVNLMYLGGRDQVLPMGGGSGLTIIIDQVKVTGGFNEDSLGGICGIESLIGVA